MNVICFSKKKSVSGTQAIRLHGCNLNGVMKIKKSRFIFE